MSSKAPWTPEQVEQLNKWQAMGIVHPFTCGSENCRADLVATVDGWICPAGCGYTQDWAHPMMLEADKYQQGMTPKVEQIINIKNMPEE